MIVSSPFRDTRQGRARACVAAPVAGQFFSGGAMIVGVGPGARDVDALALPLRSAARVVANLISGLSRTADLASDIR